MLICVALYNLVLLLGTKRFYLSTNKSVSTSQTLDVMVLTADRKRDKIWLAMSKEEKEDYLVNTRAQGNKRLDFRFAH